MLSWKILHTFKEGMKGDEVVWFEEDYNAVRDGEKEHSGHPEVATHFEVVKQSVENPHEVRQDKDYKNRKCYYAWFSGGLDYPMNHMKTCSPPAKMSSPPK